MIVWFSVIITVIGWCVDCYIDDLCPNCNLYQDSAEVRSHCAYPCQCTNRDPVCEPGVPHTRDGCGCCPVCARQDGDPCDGIAVCDQRKGLVCQYDDYYSAAGICRVLDTKNADCNIKHQINADELETQIGSTNETTREPENDIKYDNKDNNSLTQTETKSLNEKQKDYISWDDLFMASAFLMAKRSKDPETKVGACIVSSDNKIVGTGYNGMPTGCSDDDFPWGKDKFNKLNDKRTYVCHAELNAILNTNSISLQNCIIYVSLFPCSECAKIIIQSGIKNVVYCRYRNKKEKNIIENEASKKMFMASGVDFRNYIPEQNITLNFR